MAVSEALLAMGLPAEIKWPNDVLISRRKVCGILAESVWLGESLQAVVLGIGVNVSPDSVPPAGQLHFPATSLESELGSEIDRIGLLAGILHELFSWRPQMGSPGFIQAWEQRLAFRGEPVCVVRAGGGELRGLLEGISADGSLRLRMADGREERVLAGEVSLRPAG
jgi:BirA family biotin operon repressor/biotin-[acetyl-CoA-carboxylase] ligase